MPRDTVDTPAPSPALTEPCRAGLCVSPHGCGNIGYCRERNTGATPTIAEVRARRDAASWAAAVAWLHTDLAAPTVVVRR